MYLRLIESCNKNTLICKHQENHILQLFSGPGDSLAWIRPAGCGCLSRETGILRFRNGSQPNVPLHHPSSVAARETLYLIKVMATAGLGIMGLTCEFTRIARQNLVNESSLVHLNRLIVTRCPLSYLGKPSTWVPNTLINGIYAPSLALKRPSFEREIALTRS